jgi:hypothetical protein
MSTEPAGREFIAAMQSPSMIVSRRSPVAGVSVDLAVPCFFVMRPMVIRATREVNEKML